ncbi:aspartate kinase [Candidatus Legionella polyplacis]|uniref:Aspartokinase n=1 Tax=Candidatus Legionella polyplacis TaxID=2005262 RepID=A0ABZ2H1G0_9GAMM
MYQLVVKFGGSSVSSTKTWENIALIIKNHIKNGKQPIIVCSAIKNISNKLEKATTLAINGKHYQNIETEIKFCHTQLTHSLKLPSKIIALDLKKLKKLLKNISLIKKNSAKIKAQILSLGEFMITRIGCAFLKKKGINCIWYDIRKALISSPIPGKNTKNYLSAYYKIQKNKVLKKQFINSGAESIITQGFIASNPNGDTVLLGRNSSDISATLLSSILKVNYCEIWKDVPGIFTINPNIFPYAKLLKNLNYNETQKIISIGNNILHPNCIFPVKKYNIPIVIKNIYKPQHIGTYISKKTCSKILPIKSIQIQDHINIIKINTQKNIKSISNIISTINSYKFKIKSLFYLEPNIILYLKNKFKNNQKKFYLNFFLKKIKKIEKIQLIKDCSIITIIGNNINYLFYQINSIIMNIFNSKKIKIISLNSEKIYFNFVIKKKLNSKHLYKILHNKLIENIKI